jgi:hypothetical protein
MAAALEQELERMEGVLRAEANPLTGNLLIFYDLSSQAANGLLPIATGPGASASLSPGPRRTTGQVVRQQVVGALVRSTIEAAVTSLIRRAVV